MNNWFVGTCLSSSEVVPVHLHTGAIRSSVIGSFQHSVCHTKQVVGYLHLRSISSVRSCMDLVPDDNTKICCHLLSPVPCSPEFLDQTVPFPMTLCSLEIKAGKGIESR